MKGGGGGGRVSDERWEGLIRSRGEIADTGVKQKRAFPQLPDRLAPTMESEQEVGYHVGNREGGEGGG